MKNPFAFKRTPDGDLKNEAGFELRLYGMSGRRHVNLIIYSKDNKSLRVWDFSKSDKVVKNLTQFKKALVPFMQKYKFLAEKTHAELLEICKDVNSPFMQELKKELEQLQKEHTA